MCGGALFQAAKLDSGRKKNYDETGLVVSSCRHGIVLGALNLFHGETFTHTHFMHYICWKLNCKFFCYDVACRYWPFAQTVGDKFPQFKAMTENMGCMIPMMHVKVHGLSCQVNNSITVNKKKMYKFYYFRLNGIHTGKRVLV